MRFLGWKPFLLVLAGSLGACSTALGLSDYTFRANETEGGVRDAGVSSPGSKGADAKVSDGPRAEAAGDEETAADASEDVTSCDVDLGSQCYPCAPKLSAEFLNACTSAECVPFDDTVRVTHLLPDGALPPLPTNDAEAE